MEFARVGMPERKGLPENAADDRCTDSSVGARGGEKAGLSLIRSKRAATWGSGWFEWLTIDILMAALGCFLAPKPIMPLISPEFLSIQAEISGPTGSGVPFDALGIHVVG